jgi:hypothetical protein
MDKKDEDLLIASAKIIRRQEHFKWLRLGAVVTFTACYMFYINWFHTPAYSISYIDITDRISKNPHIAIVELVEQELKKDTVSGVVIRSLESIESEEEKLFHIQRIQNKPILIVETSYNINKLPRY